MEALAQVTIVLVDSHELIRSALTQLLSGDGLRVVGETQSGEEGVRLVIDRRPDVVLVELSLRGGMSGVETMEQLSTLPPIRASWCSPALRTPTGWSRQSLPGPAATC